MADQQSSELTQPCIGPFDLPEAFVAAQFSPIIKSFRFAILPVRRDQLDVALLPSFQQ
jgi:hypothetical protein